MIKTELLYQLTKGAIASKRDISTKGFEHICALHLAIKAVRNDSTEDIRDNLLAIDYYLALKDFEKG